MAYTETTRTSYGKRLGNSLGGILTGLLLFIGGVVIWYFATHKKAAPAA